MTMPTDPATVRATAQRAWDAEATKSEKEILLWHGLGGETQGRFIALVAAGVALVDTAEVERRAKYEALTKLAVDLRKKRGTVADAYGPTLADAIEERRDREYGAPAPRECVLSDGSVVVMERQFGRFNRGNGARYAGLHFWRELLDNSDTGADFDKLKAFAAEVGQ